MSDADVVGTSDYDYKKLCEMAPRMTNEHLIMEVLTDIMGHHMMLDNRFCKVLHKEIKNRTGLKLTTNGDTDE